MRTNYYLCILVAAVAAGNAAAQTLSASEGLAPPGMKAGPVAGSYKLSDFDSINLFNGKASFSFPLLDLGGRGEAGYTMTMPVESTTWQIVALNATTKYIDTSWEDAAPAGLGPGYLHRKSTGVVGDGCPPYQPIMALTYTTYVLTRPGGGSMEFYPRDAPDPKSWNGCVNNEPEFNRGNVFITKDGSSATLVLNTSVKEYPYVVGDGYRSGGEGNGYVMFKNGVRYNLVNSQVQSIVDRNGNKTVIEYWAAPSAPRSVIMNTTAGGAAQGFFVNVPATVGNSATPMLRQTIRIETRIHDFQQPAAGGENVIWSSNGGSGPQLVLRNGEIAAKMTETGATAGCAIQLGSHSDVVVRFQRDVQGYYFLQAWDYALGSVAPFATASCPRGLSGNVNLANLMNIGSDAAQSAGSLFKGRIAYVRFVPTVISVSAAAPNEIPDPQTVLDYAFNAPAQNYLLDHASLLNLTSFGSPTGEASPGENGIGVGAIKSITDSLKRVINVSQVQETSQGSNEFTQTVVYKGFGGADRTITITSGLLSTALRSGATSTISAMFNSFYSNGADSYNPVKVKSLALPNGMTYSFKYNACGEVAEVTVPTGGKVEYDWDGIAGETTGICKGRAASTGGIERFLKERRAYATGGALEQKIKYDRADTDCLSACERQDTQGNWFNLNIKNTIVGVTHENSSGAVIRSERHFYYDAPPIWRGPLVFTGWKEGKEYRSEVVKTAFTPANLNSTTLPTDNYQKVVQSWKQHGASGSFYERKYEAREDRARVTEVATEIVEAGVSRSKTDSMDYDEYGNSISETEQDWGGTVLRRKTATFLKSTYDTDLNVHIRHLPTAEYIFDGANNLAAETQYVYDDYAPSPVDLSMVARAGTISGRESGYSTTNTKRGNASRVKRWRSDKAIYLETKQRFDELGNAVEVHDALGNKTELTYTDQFSSGTTLAGEVTFGFITKVTPPVPYSGAPAAMEVSGTYDRYVGRLRTATDMNGIVSNYEYDDTLDRPTKFTRSTAETTFGYPTFTSVTSATKQNSCAVTQLVSTTEEFDGFGRRTKSKLAESGSVTIDTLTTYDGGGRVFEQYLPYRSSAAGTAKTTTIYDWMGRPSAVTAADGSVRRYGYRANQTWMRDEAGKWTKTVSDGLGRLTDVIENPAVADGTIIPECNPPTGCLNSATAAETYTTTYGYDTLGNLKTVTQSGVNQRIFGYNSLGWLMSADNPESGVITYDYDANGNLTSRSDTRGSAGVIIGYDKWNRLSSKTYTAGTAAATGNVSYTYDAHATSGGGTSYPKGRLTQVAVTGGSKTRFDQFDELGRVLKSTQDTDSKLYAFEYGYNLAGGVESVRYPYSTRTVSTCYDQAGRVATVRNGGIVSADIYAAVGQGTGLGVGDGTIEGYSALGGLQRLVLGGTLTRQWDYNSRGQMKKLWLSHTQASGTITAKMRLELGYADGANNGNVASQSIYVGGNLVATQNYVYDAVNRLKSAEEGTAWKETNGFDSRGNRWVDEANTSGLPLLTNEVAKSSAWFDTKNRLTNTGAGFGYDNAGNLTSVTSMGRTFEYDVENRQVVAVVNGKRTQYSYDGEGRRVMKLECPGTSVCTGATAGAKKTVFVYDAGGKLAQEYGELAPATARSYVFDDHLGSTRMKLSGAGVVDGWWDYLPFGGEIPGGLSGRNAVAGFAYGGVRPAMMFTGKERDAETGLDYFGARYMSAAMGRFTSADAPFADQDPSDPQSWNLYGYVRNNPIGHVDPTGAGAEPAQSWQVRALLSRYGNVNAALTASNNSSPRQLEKVIETGKWSPGVYGAVAEATAATLLEFAPHLGVSSRNMSFTFQPKDLLSEGLRPDIKMINSDKGFLDGTVIAANTPMFAEVKAIGKKNPDAVDYITAGAVSTAKTAAALAKSGRAGIAVLLVDAGTWGSLDAVTQASIRKAAGGGHVLALPGLNSGANSTIRNLRRFARMLWFGASERQSEANPEEEP